MSKSTVRAAFVAVTTLFFAWGFITSLIDPLVAAVKGIFTLTNLQAQLSAFAFFIADFAVSMSASAESKSFQATGPEHFGRCWNGEANCVSSAASSGNSGSPVPIGGELSPSKPVSRSSTCTV